MARMTAKVEGIDELVAKLRRMGISVSDSLSIAVQVGAEVIQSAANPKAPAPNIITEELEKSSTKVTVGIGPDDAHWYYRYLETGASAHEYSGNPLLAFEGSEGTIITGSVSHPGMAAKPFLRPAFDEKHKAAEDEVGAELLKVIERARK